MNLKIEELKRADDEVGNLQTVVFIDYESLFISFKKGYSVEPPLDAIISELKNCGKIYKIKVFGDFTKPDMAQERNRVRTITSDIIDCGSVAANARKDYTDFIMLDHIYQEAIQNPNIEQVILFTGDGHFSSSATFLRTFMDKRVGVYGVSGSLSRQLRECSSWTRQISVLEEADERGYIKDLLKNLYGAKERELIATFSKTIEYTVRNYGGDRYRYERLLRGLADDGYISFEPCTRYADRQFNMLVVDWEKVYAEIAPESEFKGGSETVDIAIDE